MSSRFYLMASETGCAKYIHSEVCSAVYPMLILVVMDAIGLAPWLNRPCSSCFFFVRLVLCMSSLSIYMTVSFICDICVACIVGGSVVNITCR